MRTVQRTLPSVYLAKQYIVIINVYFNEIGGGYKQVCADIEMDTQYEGLLGATIE
ncbi:hypothetical protein [Zooshikella ganghwensis]|uniref:hypothetical protein n=1 Tax=Zooshikella ganghwensis TaxID=202772 RepID=UPI0004163C18|nr:hypothetical protein [Zooshikella ganghwensis]